MKPAQFWIFTSQDGGAELQVAPEQDAVWLSQAQMAELVDKDLPRTVNEHIGNAFSEVDLEKEPSVRKFRIVRQEGKRQIRWEIEHDNLDVVISVGCRVKARSGIEFRQWTARVLKNPADGKD